MIYTGTIKGNAIEFDRSFPFNEGEQVRIDITPYPRIRKGSPQTWLTYFAETLNDTEAEIMLPGANRC